MRRQARLREHIDDGLRQVWYLELGSRQIDCDADVIRPSDGFLAGLPQHPFADRHDERGFFGERNELGGRHHPALGVMPPYQRLKAADPVGLQAHQRLIIEFEFGVCDRRSQIELQRAPGLHARVHLGLEEAVDAAAVEFGAIQSEVGIFQKLIGIRSVAGRQRHADADADHDLMAVEIEWPRDNIDQPRHQ